MLTYFVLYSQKKSVHIILEIPIMSIYEYIYIYLSIARREILPIYISCRRMIVSLNPCVCIYNINAINVWIGEYRNGMYTKGVVAPKDCLLDGWLPVNLRYVRKQYVTKNGSRAISFPRKILSSKKKMYQKYDTGGSLKYIYVHRTKMADL